MSHKFARGRATVVGAGAFGTALTTVLAQTFFEVRLWAREPEVVSGVNQQHENPLFLKGVRLPKNVSASANLGDVVPGAELLVSAVPSQFARGVMQKAVAHLPPNVPVVSVSKGIENGTLLLPTQILEECLPKEVHPYLAALSGPSFAKEIAAGVPTLVTIAARNEEVAKHCQEAFSTDTFRSYTSTDLLGIQLGGALKNVIAIAAGISDGLGLGHNTRAALITRGLAEISRLGIQLGAQPMTFAGLAGMGDLVLTCTGELSRNRTVGVELGKGKSLQDILSGTQAVAEGVKTAQSAHDLARKEGTELPICEQVYAILYEGKNPKEAVTELMTREPKAEI